MPNSPVVQYILDHMGDMLNRDLLIELFTLPDRAVATTNAEGFLVADFPVPPYQGKLVAHGDHFGRLEVFKRIPNTKTYRITLSKTDIPYSEDEDEPLMTPHDQATIPPGYVENLKNDKPYKTTIGRVFLNYLLFALPFKDLIPFWDGVWDSGRLESLVSNLIIQKKVNVDQVNQYVQNLYYIGHSPEFVSPNMTIKSLTTAPDIEQKKKELWEKYGQAIENGDASAMASYEQELIKYDKAYLKGDDSMRYLLKGKFFGVVRKKLYLTTGMVEQFGEKGQFNFIPNALEEGWTQKAFPVIANEIRAGSYSRARETAKGGEDSKFILRVFQNTRIIEDDCKSKKTLDVEIRADNSFDYLYRNFYVDNGTLETVTDTNHKDLVGKKVRFRSPMYCNTKGGYCYRCMGKLFENTQQEVLASSIQNLSSSFLNASLKLMHGVEIKTVDIGDLDQYVI